MSDATHIQSEWDRLRSGTGVTNHFGIATIPLNTDTGYGPARLAIGPTNEPQLLLPLSRSASQPDLTGLGHLTITVRRARLGDRSWRFLELTCTNVELEAVFSEVIADVIQRVSSGDSVITACLNSLTEFRDLLVTPRHAEIDDRSIRGLAAELLVLDALTQINPGAVRLWLGPTGDRHDFRGGNRGLEIKSGSRRSNHVTISSIEQLEPPTDGDLYLARVLLETSEGAAVSVSSLYDSVASKTKNHNLLIERLAEVGCRDPGSPDWNRLSFIHAGTEFYEIGIGFPRIIPLTFEAGQAPLGTTIKSYEVDLALAVEHRLSLDSAEKMMEELLSCLT